MGQAKLRGSFEQRKSEGVTKKADLEQKKKDYYVERELAMTPEQKLKRQQYFQLMTLMSMR